MKNKHVLIIGGRDHTLEKAERLGVRYSMMQAPSLVTDKQLRSSVRYAVLDYENIDEVMAVATAWHRLDPFDAIVSFAELAMHNASLCARELDLPGQNLAAVVNTRDKIRMRSLLREHALSTVAFAVCEQLEDARRFLVRQEQRPIILKPFAGGGSAGVSRVGHIDELERAWEWTTRDGAGVVIAEEYLDGPEYSVESISKNGVHEIVMITEKRTTDAPHFIELGHQMPARLARATQDDIHALVQSFLSLIGQDTAPAHTEIRLTPAGPKIIESQTRIGGDQIWEMTEIVSGVDMMGEVIAALVGIDAPARRSQASAAAIRFFALENTNIAEVSGVDKAEQADGLVRMVCHLKAGQKLGKLTWSESRQGYALCTGETVDRAVENAERALNLVVVRSDIQ